MEVKFEYLGEDKDFPDAKTYKVEAIHVTTTRNQRKFTQEELEASGRSLSFRPMNINHDEARQLPFPENATLFMEFDSKSMAVVGKFRIQDPATIAMIETGRINTVSIEQIPTKGETCNEILCEQHGVAFIGMALLESDIPPGDSRANFKAESASLFLSDLIISNAQRTCVECTDSTPCHSCKHAVEAGDDCIEKELKKLMEDDSQQHVGLYQDAQGIPDTAADDNKRDQLVGQAIENCDKMKTTEEAWFWYRRAVESYKEVCKKKKKEVINGQRTPTPDNSYTTGTI